MKAIVAESKHDKELVNLGRREANKLHKLHEKEEKTDRLKSERNALRRDVADLEVELDAGKVSHKITTAVAGTVGTAGGIALQLLVMTKVENKWIRGGTVPVVGGAMGIGGLFVPGILGAGMTGLGFGAAGGSATISTMRTVLGV